MTRLNICQSIYFYNIQINLESATFVLNFFILKLLLSAHFALNFFLDIFYFFDIYSLLQKFEKSPKLDVENVDFRYDFSICSKGRFTRFCCVIHRATICRFLISWVSY